MIKASELRLKNICNFKNIDGIDEIRAIEFEDLASIVAAEMRGAEHQFSAIPLDEKWLIIFGFIKSKTKKKYATFQYSKGVFIIYSIGVVLKHISVFGFGKDVNAKIDIGDKIDFVHQFQNLYFALTGEELTLNA